MEYTKEQLWRMRHNAPELYEALKSCRDALVIILDTKRPVDTRNRIAIANEALARVEGK